MSTLSIDIGGSGIKGMVLDSAGVPLSERIRLPTPRPATPQAVLRTVVELAAEQPEFARVSVGFPGVVQDGVVFTAPNLDDGWEGVELADRLGGGLIGLPCPAQRRGLALPAVLLAVEAAKANKKLGERRKAEHKGQKG